MALDDQLQRETALLCFVIAWMPLPVEIFENEFAVTKMMEDDQFVTDKHRVGNLSKVGTSSRQPIVAKVAQDTNTGWGGYMGGTPPHNPQEISEESLLSLNVLESSNSPLNRTGTGVQRTSSWTTYSRRPCEYSDGRPPKENGSAGPDLAQSEDPSRSYCDPELAAQDIDLCDLRKVKVEGAGSNVLGTGWFTICPAITNVV